MLAISGGSTLVEMQKLLLETSSGAVQLEGPQEVVGLLEVRPDGEDLVNEILHTDDALILKLTLDDRIVCQGNTLLVNLSESSLVDKLTHRLQVRISVRDVRVNEAEHVKSGLVQLDKNTVVHLSETKELQDLANLGRNTVDTTNADDAGELAFGLEKVVTVRFGNASESNQVVLDLAVLLHVFLCTFEHLVAFLAGGLLVGNFSRRALGSKFLITTALL